MKTLSRIAVSLVVVGLAAAGLGFWIVPEQMAQMFEITGVSGHGLVNLRADYGGLFLGAAVLAGAGVWTKHRGGVVAAAVILGLAVVGRLIGGITAGVAAMGVLELAFELLALTSLIVYARTHGVGNEAGRTGRPAL